MAERRWTGEQELAIEASGGGILVSAAAGSGKTSVLVERVVRLLTRKEDPVPADRLLIVTFTNAAAAEMRQRIYASLEKIIFENPDSALLLEQQILLDRAHIGTISSFCIDFVRQNFELLDVSPDFRIADEAEVALLEQQAVETVLEENYSEGSAAFLRISELYSSRSDRLLSDMILSLYRFIRSHPFPLEWLGKQAERYEREAGSGIRDSIGTVSARVSEMFEYAVSVIEHILPVIEEDQKLSGAYGPAFREDRDFAVRMIRLLRSGDWDEAVGKAAAHQYPALTGLKNYEDKQKQESIKNIRNNLIKDMMDRAIDYLKECSTTDDIARDLGRVTPVIRELTRLVNELTVKLDSEKRRRNVLDFSDAELLTLSLLVEQEGEELKKTDLAASYGSRFREILVDEYQDINEVQDAIFRALSDDEKNLFLVGDVKQSIYRFRKAMPELFLRRSADSHPYDGEHFPAVIRLDANFRSRPQVTDAVNYLFSRLMSARLGDVVYERERLRPMADYPPAVGTPVELHLVDCMIDDEEQEKQIVYEARHIAREIRRMIDSGVTVTSEGITRRCRYGDFCILMRSMEGKSEPFEEEFSRAGIPLWNDSSAGYFDSEEVSAVLSFLRILDNPLQDVPFLASLLSPICRYTPDEVTEIRLNSPSGTLYTAMKKDAEQGNEKSVSFWRFYEELRSFAAVNHLDELIQHLYDLTGFIAFAGASRNGEQRTANLRLLLEYARRYEETGDRGLSGFLRYIDRMIETGRDFKPANAVEENANAVRLMTIHHAKGLEFPIVIVADLRKQFNKRDLYGEIYLHSRCGIALNVRDPKTLQKYRTASSIAVQTALLDDLLSEEMRVLYVALTRARERLILIYSEKDPRGKIRDLIPKIAGYDPPSAFSLSQLGGIGEWILAAMLGSSELSDALGADPVPPQERISSGICVRSFDAFSEEGVDLNSPEDLSEIDQDLLDVLLERYAFSYPYQAVAGLPGKMTVTQIAKADAEYRVVLSKPSFLGSSQFSGAEKGTILHGFLQHLDFSNAGSVEDEIRRQVDSMYLTQEQADCIDPEKVRRFLGSGLAARMKAAGDRLYREYLFMYEMKASELYDAEGAENESILIQGIADAVIEERDGLIIIDYKTDRVSEEEVLDERYRRQLELYGEALEKSFGLPVKEKLIYSFALDRVVEIR